MSSKCEFKSHKDEGWGGDDLHILPYDWLGLNSGGRKQSFNFYLKR